MTPQIPASRERKNGFLTPIQEERYHELGRLFDLRFYAHLEDGSIELRKHQSLGYDYLEHVATAVLKPDGLYSITYHERP